MIRSRADFNKIIMAMRDDAAAIVEAVNTMPGMHNSLKDWQNWQARGDTHLRKKLTRRIFGGNYNHIGRCVVR